MASENLRHLGLWLLGRFLPKEPVLERHARNFARIAMLMVMGGLIITAAFLGGLIALHGYLTAQGLQPGASLAVIAIIALLAATICFMRADRILNNTLSISGDKQRPTEPTVQIDVALQEGISIAVSAFLSGLRGRSDHAAPPVQPDLFEDSEDEREDIIHLHPREHRHR